jgi:hypothetical protein
MVEQHSADNRESTRIDARPGAEEAPSVEQGSKSLRSDFSSRASTPREHRPGLKRRLVVGVLGVLVLAAVLIFGVPWIRLTLNTVSTDDAYVNGHVTFVAARVSGQIARVLVDDNNRVHMGLFSLQAAVAKMCSSTFPPLSGPGCVHSTRDSPSSTRLRAIAAKSPRPILGSNSGTSILSVAGAAAGAVSDDHLS